MTEPGTDVVPAGAYDGYDGLDDLDSSDMVMPRLQIVGKSCEFKDSLTGETYDGEEGLTVVVLGLIKQRVLWPPEMEEGNAKKLPLCRSYDHKVGHPDHDNFPWKASGFAKEDFDEGATLDCESCPLKDWDSHPTRSTSWCAEQYVLPVLMDADETGGSPAILTLQRSGLKPVKGYLSGFARDRKPPFMVLTKLTLEARKRGTVDYAVPVFEKIKDSSTNDDLWADFARSFVQIKGFLTTPFTRTSDETSSSTEGSDDGKKDGKAAATPPAPAAAASSPEDADEIPF